MTTAECARRARERYLTIFALQYGGGEAACVRHHSSSASNRACHTAFLHVTSSFVGACSMYTAHGKVL
jgi:hypothetical protein